MTTGTNFFKHRVPSNLKLSHVPKSHTRLVDDSKSILAEFKGENIDITSDIDNDD